MTNDANDLKPHRDLGDASVHLVMTSDEVMGFKRWLGERRPGGVMAFDLETSGLNAYAPGARIRLAQVGDGLTGWAFPWDLWRGMFLEALTDYDGPLVGHNVGYDIKWLERFSDWRAPWSRMNDTMIAARIYDPTASAGLKPLSDRYIDPRASYGQKMLDEAFVKHGWTWDTVPITFDAYWQYSSLDAIITARLYDMFLPRIGTGGPDHDAYDLEMGTLRVTTRMEQRGARVDLDYAREQYEKCWDYAERIKAWAISTFRVNIGSPGALGKWFVTNGGEITVLTPTGKPKVDKYQLKLFADPDNEYPAKVRMLAEQVLLFRKYGKLATSYFEKILQVAEQTADGHLVHASINPLGARTGRMSISDPPLQQLPRGDSLVRNMFMARDGNGLISTDFSQIEMRMLAHFSNDAELQTAFRVADETGGDFFVEVGKEIYSEPDFQKSDKRRGLIKNSMYGMAYGAGPTKMAESAGVPVDRMRAVVESLTKRYPGIKNFMRTVEDTGKRREMETGQGWIVGIDGRRYPCDSGKTYTLTNYLIQGGAAVAFKRALLRLDDAGYGDWFLVPVHDEILVDIPEDLVPEAMTDIPKVMRDDSMSVSIPADAEGAYAKWGAKYE